MSEPGWRCSSGLRGDARRAGDVGVWVGALVEDFQRAGGRRAPIAALVEGMPPPPTLVRSQFAFQGVTFSLRTPCEDVLYRFASGLVIYGVKGVASMVLVSAPLGTRPPSPGRRRARAPPRFGGPSGTPAMPRRSICRRTPPDVQMSCPALTRLSANLSRTLTFRAFRVRGLPRSGPPEGDHGRKSDDGASSDRESAAHNGALPPLQQPLRLHHARWTGDQLARQASDLRRARRQWGHRATVDGSLKGRQHSGSGGGICARPIPL
jgi:hypothetical protein